MTSEFKAKVAILIDIAHHAEHALDDSCEDDWTHSHRELNDQLDKLMFGYDDIHEVIADLVKMLEES